MTPSKLLREPLTHFVLIGAAIMVAGRVLGPRAGAPQTQDTIRVTIAQIDSLTGSFEARRGRPPTREETAAIVDQYVREEALVREALAQGMAEEDSIVRGRLAQRMRFFGAAGADEIIPTDEQLDRFRLSHPDMFTSPERATFDHVFLDPKVWGPKVDERANELLKTLRGPGGQADPEKYSDPFRRPTHYDLYGLDVVERTYGSSFGDLVRRAPLGEWVGPVESVYGVHLIRVAARAPGELLPLDTVRDSVALAWRDEQRAEATRAFEDELLTKYKVEIEPPKTEEPTPGSQP